MLHDRRAQQVEADYVIAQWCAKLGGDRFRDLDSCKLHATLAQTVPGQRRNGDEATRSAVEERLDLPIAFHAIGKTSPTGALPWPEYWPYERENARGLDEQPGRTLRQMLTVQFSQSFFEIVVHKRDR
jgi:hypothetical protein